MADPTHRHGFREWARAPLECPVLLYFGDSEVAEARTINLSAGGFFVPMRPVKPVGTLLRFELELPDQVKVSGFAEVVWLRVRAESGHRPAGVGVRYRYLEDPAREAIRLVVAQREAEEALLASNLTAPGGVPSTAPEDDATLLLRARPLAAPPPAAVPEAPPEPPGPAASTTLFETAARLQEAGQDPGRKRRLTGLLIGLAAVLLLALGATWLLNDGFGGPEPPAREEPIVRRPRKAKVTPPPEAAQPVPEATAGAEPQGSPQADSTEPAPVPVDPGPPFTRVLGLSSRIDSGATTVRVELDGAPDSSRIVSLPIGSGSPRHLLRLQGVREAVDPAVLMVGSNEVRRVRSGLHGRPTPTEMHLVIDLAGPRVHLGSLASEGRSLVLVFVEEAAQERR